MAREKKFSQIREWNGWGGAAEEDTVHAPSLTLGNFRPKDPNDEEDKRQPLADGFEVGQFTGKDCDNSVSNSTQKANL